MAEICEKCKKRHFQVWQASDDLWTIVSGHSDHSGLLCMKCFERMAKKKGIIIYWECAVERFPTEKW